MDFDNIEDLLAYYEKNSIHYKFKTIGHCFTEAEYNKKQEYQDSITGKHGKITLFMYPLLITHIHDNR